MTLQRKFVALLVMVVAAVGIIAGMSLWSVNVLQREVTLPLTSIQRVLAGLHQIRLASTRTGDLIIARTAEAARSELESQQARIDTELAALESDETYVLRGGIGVTKEIRAGVQRLADALREWLASGSHNAREDALAEISRLNGLIQRAETRLIGDMSIATSYAREVRRLVLISLAIAFASVTLAGSLGAVLVRRWVLRPVRRLREAASRFGTGDLDYRIHVEGTDEIAQLSNEANAMAATIARMQEERIERERLAAVGEMVRRIAHNIRNPLAGIRSLAELTRSDLPDSSSLAENQDRIVRTVDRFEAWVAQLLTATTPLSIDPCDSPVTPWIHAVVDTRRASAESCKVALELLVQDAPDVARFDARQLEQAVAAVLDNALSVTPSGQRVTVSVAARADAWTIEIRDAGPGVPEEIRSKIFKPYFTTRRDGTGLGLAMASQVVEQHGGRIEVESDGQGALFRFVLPGASAAPARPANRVT